jgi:exodeoxyribonuclease VII large subunit
MNEKLTLTELQLIIKDSLYMALPDMYWVIAEISEMKENYNGHCYLELVDKQVLENSVRSRVKAVIWSSRYRFLKSFFENTTSESLREGMKILIRVKVEYHEIYGLSLVINDIDPAFTIGELALKRQQILKKLEEEGVLTMNKELDFPVVPQRIAVISSAGAAGYSDFIRHLTDNSYGYVFITTLFETPMQGNETEAGVISSLERIASRLEKFNLVAIIRGGGSQSDLSWFDNYSIAYYITQFPLPVITGIGHEKDLSVADIVAHRSLKTPTAVADYLVECMSNTENHLIEISNDIFDKSRNILEDNKMLIDASRLKLIPVARMMISEFKEDLSGILIEMINTGKDYIMRAGLFPARHKSRLISGARSYLSSNGSLVVRERQSLSSIYRNYLNNVNSRISGYKNSLKILDPENVLKRGYTITSFNGKIIKKRSHLKKDDIIDTKFSDGSIASKVV